MAKTSTGKTNQKSPGKGKGKRISRVPYRAGARKILVRRSPVARTTWTNTARNLSQIGKETRKEESTNCCFVVIIVFAVKFFLNVRKCVVLILKHPRKLLKSCGPKKFKKLFAMLVGKKKLTFFNFIQARGLNSSFI